MLRQIPLCAIPNSDSTVTATSTSNVIMSKPPPLECVHIGIEARRIVANFNPHFLLAVCQL